jgi:hypothetical protein
MIAVETLYLTSLLSAFIGLIALFVLIGPAKSRPAAYSAGLGNVIVLATLVSLGAFFVYALSPRAEARAVYASAAINSP